jgi:hypothetical protein
MLGRGRRAARCALFVALCAALVHRGAWAQTGADSGADELAAARSLFAEALRDEEAKRFLDALEKFQRVRAVRDTASIEYRIGSCYERLGRTVAAYVAYHDATLLGRGDERSADVVKAAIERLESLATHLARLTLVLPEPTPSSVEVRVDGLVVAPASLRDAVALEPGRHVVTAASTDSTPFRSEVTVPEGAQVSLTISLEARPSSEVAAAPPPQAVRPPTGGAAPAIAMAGGGVLLVASGVLFLLREEDISKLNRECPRGACPAGANRNDLDSTRRRALMEGPVAVALCVGGAVAAGLGAYFLWTAMDPSSHTSRTTARVAPLLAWGTAGIVVDVALQ